MSDTARFQKILALAVNPAAPDGEANAAFAKLRELVRQNPHLSAPPAPPQMSTPMPAEAEEILQWRLINTPPFWLPITIGNLSEQAYNLGLRNKIVCDFKETPVALNITCAGSKQLCDAFAKHLDWFLNYINSQPADPSSG